TAATITFSSLRVVANDTFEIRPGRWVRRDSLSTIQLTICKPVPWSMPRSLNAIFASHCRLTIARLEEKMAAILQDIYGCDNARAETMGDFPLSVVIFPDADGFSQNLNPGMS